MFNISHAAPQPCRPADFVTFGTLDFERCATCLDIRNRSVNDDELTQVTTALSPTAASAAGSLPTLPQSFAPEIP